MLSDVIRLTMNMMLYEIEADIIGFAIYGTLIGSFWAVILNVSNNHRNIFKTHLIHPWTNFSEPA